MKAQTEGWVKTTLNGNIAQIAFSSPKQNALSMKLLNDLEASIQDASQDDSVRIMVLQSAGEKAFCAGASFEELSSIENIEQGTLFFSGFAKVINAIRKTSKIVIVRVQGKAVGGGVGIAAAADYCFATKNAAIRLSELAVGIGAFVISPAVTRKVGIAAFSQLSLTPNQWYDASWAREKGLYAEVCDDIKSLDLAVAARVKELSELNPEALFLLKKLFWEGTEHWDALLAQRAAMSGKLVLSDFTRNAISQLKKP